MQEARSVGQGASTSTASGPVGSAWLESSLGLGLGLDLTNLHPNPDPHQACTVAVKVLTLALP